MSSRRRREIGVSKTAREVKNVGDEIQKLDRARANPKVDADTSKAHAKIGKFATDMHARISAAVKALPDVDLTIKSTETERQIQTIRNQLAQLSDKKIGVDLSAEQFHAEWAASTPPLWALAATLSPQQSYVGGIPAGGLRGAYGPIAPVPGSGTGS